jgi:hypothetical protein
MLKGKKSQGGGKCLKGEAEEGLVERLEFEQNLEELGRNKWKLKGSIK